MAAALTANTDKVKGDVLHIAGTGFANSTAYTAKITLPGPDAPSVTLKGTTSSGGAVDTSTVADIYLAHEGEVTYVVSDGTSTVTDSVRVWNNG